MQGTRPLDGTTSCTAGLRRALRVRRCLAVGLALVAFLPAIAQESTNYKLDRVTLAAGASTASSATYDTRISVEQITPAASTSACNLGSQSVFGFWSILGPIEVPVRLSLGKDAGDREVVELFWSGSGDMFDVFRAFAPQNLEIPANIDQTVADCFTTDPDAGGQPIIFYLVAPTG